MGEHAAVAEAGDRGDLIPLEREHRQPVGTGDRRRPAAFARACRAQPPDHRITYSIPADARARSIIGSTTVDAPVLRVDRRRPVVIGAPLRGSGWLDGNGCCDNPTANHRLTTLAFDGTVVDAEVFAIDWVRLVGGVLYTGDGKQNSDWTGFGAAVYSVADGTVVSTVDGLPDIPPFEANPGLRTPSDWGATTPSSGSRRASTRSMAT